MPRVPTGKVPGSGRKKGTPNKANLAAIEFFKAKNFDPLERMIHEYENCDDPKVRATLLKELARYRHPSLSSITLEGSKDRPLNVNVNLGAGRSKPKT